MANRRNAIKKIRADAEKYDQNKSGRSELRTLIRQFLAACSDKKFDSAKSQVSNLFSKLDRAVKKGVLKENTANRRKSRVSRRLNAAKA